MSNKKESRKINEHKTINQHKERIIQVTREYIENKFHKANRTKRKSRR
ncbi:hypothetical protein ACFLZ8_02835 [Planctomycetota bacterium]